MIYPDRVPGPFFMLIYTLAFYRVTRLIVRDKVFDTPRTKLSDALIARRRTQLVYLLHCPWCVSIWIGAISAPVIYLWGRSPWLYVPALALALSAATGLLARGD